MSSLEPVSRLVILRGNFNFSFSEGNYRNFVYSIDREIPSVQNIEVLNDQELLHSCALQIRDAYTKWVYGLNEEFLRSGLIKDELSLFFLSDFSCKRSEIFDTYNSICNLLVIQEKLRDTSVSEAILVGVDKQFYRAFVSAFPDIKSCLREHKQERAQVFRTLVSNTVYFLELFVVGIYNLLDIRNVRSDRSPGGRYFFSPYPQHLSPEMIGGEDIKYRKFVRPEDKYLASILMDGLHQHIGLGQFIKLKRKLPVARFTLLDNYINPLDVLSGIYWSLRGGTYSLTTRKKKYVFLEIDITAYVKKELQISFSRIARLMVMEKQLRRFFYYNDIDELVYYLFEYPIGRLLSYVVGTSQNRVTRIGFQHGPASWIKMLYFLAPGESSSRPPFLSYAPVPDRILAEDSPSAEIYRHSGYDNVQIMDNIYRLDYLADVKIDFDQDSALIVPGLHDGQLLLNIMKSFIQEHPTITCCFRPHPRANNSYVSFFDSFVNLYIAYEPIEELLQKVSRVFVTYSSVGVEANWLGLDVTIVEIPGRLNESPLLDRP